MPDHNGIDSCLKIVFLSSYVEEALNQINAFNDKLCSIYPMPVYNIEKNLSMLLKYYEYPEPLRRSIHSINIIERKNKEIRRRINIIDSPSSEESAMRIIYLKVAEINERWFQRSLRVCYKYMDEVREMFQKRYPL